MFQFHTKYKNKSFEEISGLVRNDKKIMQTLIRSLNHPSTSADKKNEITTTTFFINDFRFNHRFLRFSQKNIICVYLCNLW